ADPDAQLGVAAMATTLTDALQVTTAARAAGHTELDPDQARALRSAYAGALARIRTDNAPGRTPTQQRALTLATRFEVQREMILRFLADLAVPFTNYADIAVMPMRARESLLGRRSGMAMSA